MYNQKAKKIKIQFFLIADNEVNSKLKLGQTNLEKMEEIILKLLAVDTSIIQQVS